MLETMRRVMRGLVRLIPVKRRGVVYTDFEDELGELTPAELKGIVDGYRTAASSSARFVCTCAAMRTTSSCRSCMRGHQITSFDLVELERVFLDLGFGTEADIDLVTEEHEGFGLFLRSVTGLTARSGRRGLRAPSRPGRP